MQDAGFGRSAQFWAAVLTSAPQPVGALVAFLLVEQVQALLPISFAFAAGAMLALVAWDMAPEAFGRATWPKAAVGAVAGGCAMLALGAVLGV
jgi:ZIP family zinc transporter